MYDLIDDNEESETFGKALLKEKVENCLAPAVASSRDKSATTLEKTLSFTLVYVANGWFVDEICEKVERLHAKMVERGMRIN